MIYEYKSKKQNKMVNYQNGKIYQIVNDVNSKVYIGSTCQTLCKRMHAHRGEGKALHNETPIYIAMHEIGVDHFRIILVQNAPCNSKEELHAIEYEVAQRYQQRGVILYNATVDGRCSKETRARMSKSQCKRGCVAYHRTLYHWSFTWYENAKRVSKSFSVNKYGYDAARGLALYWQEERYPLEREDDSELIREIRARAEA